MTTKARFKLGDSVVINSRKSDWYGKIGKVVILYENGRCGVSYRGETVRVYKATSLCCADERYEALIATNSDWRKAIKDELKQLNGHDMFVNPRNTVKMNASCRHPETVNVETVDDDSSIETDNDFETNTIGPKPDYGKNSKKGSTTSETGEWTWTKEPENNNDTMHTTTMTNDDGSIDQNSNQGTESTMSQEGRRVSDYQTTLLIERVQELAGENAILRMQNSRKNRIIALLMEDFKGMDIRDAYFPDSRLK
jgi:hypothetical protein